MSDFITVTIGVDTFKTWPSNQTIEVPQHRMMIKKSTITHIQETDAGSFVYCDFEKGGLNVVESFDDLAKQIDPPPTINGVPISQLIDNNEV